jgi:predicted ABC-type ATPase
MFAGPNGSGKSTLIQEVRKSYNVGYFINADEIEFLLSKQKYLDCSLFFPKVITQKD